MRYIEVAKKSFKNNLVYRVECISEIINLLVVLIANISIWRAVYKSEGDLTGVPFLMIVTYVLLALIIFTMFSMDDYYIEKKFRSGGIAFEMLRPMNFTLYILAYNLGILAFKMVFLFIPITVIGTLVFHLLSPFSKVYFAYFILSVILGYFIMYSINYIVWLCTFWLNRIFSLVTIKDTLLMVLSGAVFPLWMFPDRIQEIINYTPFKAVLYIPVSIYLGQVSRTEVYENIGKQVVWLIVLVLLGQLIWRKAKKNFIVQGG